MPHYYEYTIYLFPIFVFYWQFFQCNRVDHFQPTKFASTLKEKEKAFYWHWIWQQLKKKKHTQRETIVPKIQPVELNIYYRVFEVAGRRTFGANGWFPWPRFCTYIDRFATYLYYVMYIPIQYTNTQTCLYCTASKPLPVWPAGMSVAPKRMEKKRECARPSAYNMVSAYQTRRNARTGG